ncbi:hypothetical protein RRG08_029629 [Elysia crispata]|uniref:Uncharacterized protein n=1 Tax=Elysia crispata TaxID=231223 RepID=A0AAE0XP96_9GAST|nr:hypothetical protein RRG08_029629 [Elysia crispata]
MAEWFEYVENLEFGSSTTRLLELPEVMDTVVFGSSPFFMFSRSRILSLCWSRKDLGYLEKYIKFSVHNDMVQLIYTDVSHLSCPTVRLSDTTKGSLTCS